MNFSIYDVLSAVIIFLIIVNIKMMASPRTAVMGNRLGAFAVCAGIVVVLAGNGIIDTPLLIVSLVIGALTGLVMVAKITTLRIPQFVALLNGFGGAASLLVSLVVIFETGIAIASRNQVASFLAIVVGGVTFGGSIVAAAKLDNRIEQKPVILRGHTVWSLILIFSFSVCFVLGFLCKEHIQQFAVSAAVLSLLFGIVFSIRIGGADMPVSISLLNSFSGLAASICGFAINDFLLVSVGAVVGAAGLILTRIMCTAMNRSLLDILTGGTSTNRKGFVQQTAGPLPKVRAETNIDYIDLLQNAKNVIIVPGYGMALSQAQWNVKALYETLLSRGADVKFAIHPVAGRMPGHMNVLLAEVDIPYEKLYEMELINPEFSETDVVIVIGACDVVNPSAISAAGTPIYGMPILNAHEAKHVIVCNRDTHPGYSGVDNPLYEKDNVILLPGNASDTIEKLNLALAQKIL